MLRLMRMRPVPTASGNYLPSVSAASGSRCCMGRSDKVQEPQLHLAQCLLLVAGKRLIIVKIPCRLGLDFHLKLCITAVGPACKEICSNIFMASFPSTRTLFASLRIGPCKRPDTNAGHQAKAFAVCQHSSAFWAARGGPSPHLLQPHSAPPWTAGHGQDFLVQSPGPEAGRQVQQQVQHHISRLAQKSRIGEAAGCHGSTQEAWLPA